jgi:hypothetical protein
MMDGLALTATTLTRDDFLGMFMGFAGQANTIHVPKPFLMLCDYDFPAAVLLNQILYWMPRAASKEGWVIKSYAQWFEEICLTEYQIRRATKKLAQMGLQTILKRSRIHNAAPTIHYRFDKMVLTDCILKFLHNRETQGSHSEETQGTYTESLTKTTKKKKESPAKKSSDQKPTSAPIGDSLSGDDPIAAAEAIVIDAFAGSGTTSVKAEDSVSKPADSKTTEKILPRPRAKAAGAAPTATEPAAPHPRNPLQDVICWGWKTKPGPWAGKLGQFFTASMPKDAKDAWASKQPDSSATPQEIAAFTLWYSQHPSYSKSFVEHGSKMPTTPTVLRDRLDEFRSAIGYQIAMNKAVAILERLSKGEQGAITPGSDSGAVESVQSFKRFNSKAETAYTARLDPDDDPENSPEETPVGVFS